MDYHQRLAAAQLSKKRSHAYQSAIDGLVHDFDRRIALLSQEHKVPEHRVRTQVYRQAELFDQRRGPNCWNAFVQTRMEEANADREPGHRLKLPDVITPDVRAAYGSLSQDQREELLDKHKTFREAHQAGRVVSDRASHQIALAQLKRIDESLDAMYHQHGLHFILITVRSSVNSYIRPHMMYTEQAANFWRLMMKQQFDSWALRFESFCIGGIHELIQNDIAKSGDLRGDIRKALGDKLIEATGDPKAVMSYANYQQNIVEKYHVVLEGWPFPVLRNLSQESAPNSTLVQLLRSLRIGDCYFRKLSVDEIAKLSSHDNLPTSTTQKKSSRRGPQEATIQARVNSLQAAHAS